MKYWNKPFVLEIYIRVTKKNCIYTIKIGYGLTLIQKNYVKSPFGVFTLPNIFSNLWFKNRTVSIPFGVSALPNFVIDWLGYEVKEFQSPLGFLFFQTEQRSALGECEMFQSPLGFLFFQTEESKNKFSEYQVFQSPLGFLLF
mgnify:CR=1 FL=1